MVGVEFGICVCSWVFVCFLQGIDLRALIILPKQCGTHYDVETLRLLRLIIQA